MPALLVICGLGGPESGYGRFFDLLRNRSHARLSPAVWAVETAESPKNLYEELKPHVGKNDSLYVMRMPPAYAGRGSPAVLDWLKRHIR